MIQLTNGSHSVTLDPHGATVLSWKHDGIEQLFVSPRARFEDGVAIRGGIPVCWPWFSREHPGPSHGVARTRRWTLLEHFTDRVVLQLRDSPSSRRDWPHAFELTLEVQLTDALELTLRHHNTDAGSVRVWGAFHTYFRLPDPRAALEGLEDAEAIDKLTGEPTRHHGTLHINPPIDTIFERNSATLVADRRVRVEGHDQIVVWNPGSGASDIADLGSPDGFVCVEAARVAGYARVLEAGQSDTFRMRLSVEPARDTP